jgi:GAF domain-containing protein
VDVMTPSISDSGGPVLDEATFQKLLAAAYMLQEHNDRLRAGEAPTDDKKEAPAVDSDSTAALAQIVDAQHQIHSSNLDLVASMSLIVERIRKITGAQGAAIGILDQGNVAYRAGSGNLASRVGSTLRPEAALSASTLLHDVLLRCPDASNDFRVNPEIARRLGVQSFIAVPVFHDGKTAGALELVFAKASSFKEHDVRTCQLMAGLITEALTHAAQAEWRKGVAAERASMLEVLERIKPQLARLAHSDAHEASTDAAPENVDDFTVIDDSKCKHCGNDLAAEEAFCGACGTSRSAVSRNDLQSKWATLWNLKKAGGQIAEAETQPAESVLKPTESFILPDPSLTPQAKAKDLSEETAPIAAIPEISEPIPPAESSVNTSVSLSEPGIEETPAPATPDEALVPSKTDEQPEWLHSIAVSPPAVQLKGFWQKHQGFIKKHPGDLALGAAAILFLITILWAVSSDHPTTSAADSGNPQTSAAAPAKPKRKQPPPAPELSFFDSLLVSLGLAEPPPAPTYTGNPNVPVWIDVHTALYYCPGADLYGKTPQGKIASQHDAQLDQFEPAFRKVCD